MKIIALLNEKGGCGKSTIAVNLAVALNYSLYDLDPQGSAFAWNAVETTQRLIDTEEDAWEFIADIKRQKNILLDCPPGIDNYANSAALAVADLALIPVTASGADILATGRMITLAKKASNNRRGKPKIALVPNRVDRRTGSGRTILEDLAAFEQPLTPTLGSRTAFADCFAAQQWVGAYAKNSSAHREIMELAQWVKIAI